MPDSAIFCLCDPCFEAFMVEHDRRVAEHGENQITDTEFTMLTGHVPKKEGN